MKDQERANADNGARFIMTDLEECTSMDKTFIGFYLFVRDAGTRGLAHFSLTAGDFSWTNLRMSTLNTLNLWGRSFVAYLIYNGFMITSDFQ